jgi:hypothetical protein
MLTQDNPMDKVGVEPHLPIRQLNVALGMDKWQHRPDKAGFRVIHGGKNESR